MTQGQKRAIQLLGERHPGRELRVERPNPRGRAIVMVGGASFARYEVFTDGSVVDFKQQRSWSLDDLVVDTRREAAA